MIIKADTSLKTIYGLNPVVLRRHASVAPEVKVLDRTKRWMTVLVLIILSLLGSYAYWIRSNGSLYTTTKKAVITASPPIISKISRTYPGQATDRKITTLPTKVAVPKDSIAKPAATPPSKPVPTRTANSVVTAKPIETIPQKPISHAQRPIRTQPIPAAIIHNPTMQPTYSPTYKPVPTNAPTIKPTFSDDPDNPFINFVADFRPFVNGIKKALETSGTLNTSACNVPDRAVIFTLSNYHTFPLLQLRQDIMTKAGIITCMQQRFITVCLDKKCLDMCEAASFANCILLVIPETVYGGFGLKTTMYQKNSYNYIVWVKYEMFVEALMVANEVFYFDADVMLYGNPFPHAQNGRDQQGKPIPGPYEIMYQRERGMKERGCGGSVNGGLFYLRNSTGMHERFLPAILQHREAIINLTGRLDQDIVGDYVRLVKYCTLPVNRFMGFCISSQDANGYNPKDMITFHPNCVAGMQAKTQAIRDFSFSHFGSPL